MNRNEHFAAGTDDGRSHEVPYWHWDPNGGSEVRHSTLGKTVTDEDRWVFQNGQCHALAEHLHKSEGHPIYSVSEHGMSGKREVTHFVNAHKDDPNLIHDADGWQNIQDFHEKWDPSGNNRVILRKVSLKAMQQRTENNPDWLAPHHEGAAAFYSRSNKGNR